MKEVMKVERVDEIIPAPDGSTVVVRAEVVAGGERSAIELAIATDLAPQMAIALLATTAKARADRDGSLPALEALAAAVVASGHAETVRLHLLFDKGAVLPVELALDAAQALHRGLGAELKVASKPPNA